MPPNEPGRNGASTDDGADDETATVLAVDDDAALAEMYAVWLREGYDVRTANDGESALAAMTDEVDVVLLDRRMPGMTGDEVLEALRGEGYEARVSMLTAVEPEADIVDMSFDEYLLKPVSRDDVVEVVERLLARADYDDGLQAYFAVSTKIATFEAEHSPKQRAESDALAELRERKAELEADVEGSLDDVGDFEEAFREIES